MRELTGINRRQDHYVSVCAQGGAHISEAYRVRLPTNHFGKSGIVIGEGKPENQNHASIFCLGEALQTIDMNQASHITVRCSQD